MNEIQPITQIERSDSAIDADKNIAIVQVTLAEFDKVQAGITALKAKYNGVVFDVKSTKGMAEATAARAEIREPRYATEKARKAGKAPITAIGKILDDKAKWITAELEAIEEPIDKQIKAEEARKEAEKQVKIRAEQERIASIRKRIAEMVNAPLKCVNVLPSVIQAAIAELDSVIIDESFGELFHEAQNAKADSLSKIRASYEKAVAYYKEAARIKAEREELEKLRAEQAAAAAAERAKIAEERRELEAIQKAERDRQDVIARAHQAEADRIAAEKREPEQQQELVTPIAIEPVTPKAVRQIRPTDQLIIEVLAEHFRAHESKIIEWLLDMDLEAASKLLVEEM